MPVNLFIVGAAVTVLGMLTVVAFNPALTIVPIAVLVIMIAVMAQQMISKTIHDRDRIFAAMFLIISSILFWALFEQAGSSLNLFTDRHVDRGGVPASVFQSINAIYIILLAPVFATLVDGAGPQGA